jgi:hypothetical protein
MFLCPIQKSLIVLGELHSVEIKIARRFKKKIKLWPFFKIKMPKQVNSSQ